MVIGKLKYLLEPAMEHTPHCLVFGHARVQGKKGKSRVGDFIPHACV